MLIPSDFTENDYSSLKNGLYVLGKNALLNDSLRLFIIRIIMPKVYIAHKVTLNIYEF